jgi:hypothetical protein
MFRYHGIEYLQCGQWDGGLTTLRPRGRRWMQTFRKLPTIEPKTKKTTLQKWNGTLCHVSGSNIGLIIVGKAALQEPDIEENSKLQTPNSREIANAKPQAPSLSPGPFS